MQQSRARSASCAWTYPSPANGRDLFTEKKGALTKKIRRQGSWRSTHFLQKELPRNSIGFVFEHRLDLIAQFHGIPVPVRRHGMLHRRIEHFLFRAGNFYRAVFVTWIIPAINRFSV